MVFDTKLTIFDQAINPYRHEKDAAITYYSFFRVQCIPTGNHEDAQMEKDGA
jgi:hypothetical protein